MGRPHTERLGAAIAEVLSAADLSQTELAKRLRARGYMVDQSRISKWIRGVDIPSEVSIYPAIEQECGARLGTIFRAAGFVVDDPSDVRAAIMADPTLDEFLKEVLLANYEGIQRALAIRSNVSPVPASAVPSS